jgi:Mg2+ and Co2+ transporter CorA
MSRHTENKEELLKVYNTVNLINQRLDTLENNHLAHIQKDIDRIIYVLGAVGLAVFGELFILLNKVL